MNNDVQIKETEVRVVRVTLNCKECGHELEFHGKRKEYGSKFYEYWCTSHGCSRQYDTFMEFEKYPQLDYRPVNPSTDPSK